MAIGDIIASLAVKISGDITEFDKALSLGSAKLTKFSSDVNTSLKKSFAESDKAAREFAKGFGRLGTELQGVGKNLTAGVTAPLTALGVGAIKAFGDIQSLKKGLEAVTGSSAKAATRFKELTNVAKLPGLGLEEVVKADIRLQTIGFTAGKSEKSIRAFGNAIATVGGGRAEFDRAIYGLQQLANTKFPLGEDLNIIKDALPQVTPLLNEAFGTARSDELAKLGVTSKQVVDTIVNGLSKLPPVSGGVKNALENLGDTGKQSLARLGEEINKSLNIEGKLDTVAQGVESLTDAFVNLSPGAQTTVLGMAAVAAATGPVLFGIGSLIKTVPTLITALNALGLAGVSNGAKLKNGLALGVVVAGLTLAVNQYADLVNQQKANQDFAINSAQDYLARYQKLSAQEQTLERARLTKQFESLAQRKKVAEETKKIYDSTITDITSGTGPNRGDVNALSDARIGSGRQAAKAKEYQVQLDIVLERIKAIDAANAEINKTQDELNKTLTLTGDKTNKVKDILDGVYKALAAAEQEAILFGPAFDLAAAKADILTGGIKSLLNEGLKASTKEVQTLDTLLSKIRNEGLGKLKFEVDESIPENTTVLAPKFKLPLGEVDQGTQALLAVSRAFADATEEAKAFGTENELAAVKQQILGQAIQDIIANKFPGYQDVIEKLKAQFGELNEVTLNIGQSLANFAGDQLASFTEALVTGGNAMENFGAKVLSSVGDFLIQLGQAAIAKGVAELAILTFGSPAAAIAAGAAAIALGGALRGVAKNATAKSTTASPTVSTGFGSQTAVGNAVTRTVETSSSVSPTGSQTQYLYLNGELSLVDRNGALIGYLQGATVKQNKTGGR